MDLTIAFSAEVIISITKNPEAWVADYPPEIQAEYYKTHENKREKLTKGTIVRKSVAIIVALFLFARIKRWSLLFFADWCRSGYFKRRKDMAGGFTEEQRNSIRKKLLEAGVSLSTSMGFKRMTVASVAREAGVSVGSFYNFFSSKEAFALAMINELENRSLADFMEKLDGVGTISVREFLHWYREYFRPETNFLLRLKLEDTIWLKSHIAGGSYFENGPDMERIQKIIPYVTGVRIDFDPGVVINFIKSIYASYQNRDPFFEEALQMNVDLIFEAIYRYVCLGH